MQKEDNKVGKATIENSQRLDAHFWATDPVQRTAGRLVSALTDYRQRIRAGATAGHTQNEHAQNDRKLHVRNGLVPMNWTRGWDKSPAGNILWGALAQSEGRITRLLLLFQITSYGQAYPRRQEVELVWQTPGGKTMQKPVLLCPFCRRRCRFLCAASPGRLSGPYLGEFACRLCAGLCYARQLESKLEYKSAWAKSLDTVLGLAAKADRHPERLTEEDVAQARDASLAVESILNRRLERLLRLLGKQGVGEEESLGEEETVGEDGPVDVHVTEGRAGDEQRAWDVLPPVFTPPMFTPPKRRGRPSPKRARQQARACAKLLREAEKQLQKDAKPASPPGRPKERRAYDGSRRAASGCAGRLGPDEGYCVGCRARRLIVSAEVFTASNGRVGIKGKCAECGHGLCRLGASPAAAA